jgi:hypothetical protein
MGKQHAKGPWWHVLNLDAATAKKVSDAATEAPADLAGIARSVPDTFRRTFDAKARAELTRALTAHLAGTGDSTEGYRDLLEALEELEGKRPPKPLPPLPSFGLGAVDPATAPGSHQPTPTAPLPHLPKLKRQDGATDPD